MISFSTDYVSYFSSGLLGHFFIILNVLNSIFNKTSIFFQHAPGIPKVLVGNRLHLAFKRQVDQAEAETYAEKNAMGFFEVSPLVNFNISETFVELARKAIMRNGMERLWRSNKGNLLVEHVKFNFEKKNYTESNNNFGQE